MANSWCYFKFLGVHSFVSTLDAAGTGYLLFPDKLSELFRSHEDILSEDDSLVTGMVTEEGQQTFFAELGIKITKSYRSYFVYFFDHHPTFEDLACLVQGLETVIQENLSTIDPSVPSEAGGRVGSSGA